MELSADSSQWPVRLRGQEQDDERGVQIEPARRKPNADGDGNEGHRQRGHQLENRG